MPRFSAAASESQRRLYQSRLYAIGLLLLACILFIISCLYLHQFQAMAYLKAFAEAAMVGALADWFAVTALFRHPLGLPIPHTAILVHKQPKIANELGRFIELNFLQGKAIATRIYQWHPAQKALTWLSEPHHRQQWLPPLVHELPTLLRAVKPAYITRLLKQLLNQPDSGQKLGNTVANLLTLLHQQHLDIQLLRVLLQQIRHCLQHQDTRQLLENSLITWADNIKKEDPSSWDKLKASLKTTVTARIDDWVASKVLEWANTYIAAALENPHHALWRSYRKQYLLTERQLRRNPQWQQKLVAAQQQLIHSVTLQHNIEQWRQSLIYWSEQDVAQTDSWWQQQFNRLLDYSLGQLHAHPHWIFRLDTRLAIWIKHIIEDNKQHAAQFVVDKVNSWDSQEMINKLELSIGRDLQFIRINGTIVGGLIGLLIYACSQLLMP